MQYLDGKIITHLYAMYSRMCQSQYLQSIDCGRDEKYIEDIQNVLYQEGIIKFIEEDEIQKHLVKIKDLIWKEKEVTFTITGKESWKERKIYIGLLVQILPLITEEIILYAQSLD